MWFLSSTVGILVYAVFIIEMNFTAGKSLTELYVNHGSLHRQLLHLTEMNSQGSTRFNGSNIAIHRDQATNLPSIRYKRSREMDKYKIAGSNLTNNEYCKYKVELSTYYEYSGVQMYHISCDGSIGEPCQNTNCCMQTYEMVKVPTSPKSHVTVKIFTGCVCANMTIPRSSTGGNFTA